MAVMLEVQKLCRAQRKSFLQLPYKSKLTVNYKVVCVCGGMELQYSTAELKAPQPTKLLLFAFPE